MGDGLRVQPTWDCWGRAVFHKHVVLLSLRVRSPSPQGRECCLSQMMGVKGRKWWSPRILLLLLPLSIPEAMFHGKCNGIGKATLLTLFGKMWQSDLPEGAWCWGPQAFWLLSQVSSSLWPLTRGPYNMRQTYRVRLLKGRPDLLATWSHCKHIYLNKLKKKKKELHKNKIKYKISPNSETSPRRPDHRV